jgi:hypothetical protein
MDRVGDWLLPIYAHVSVSLVSGGTLARAGLLVFRAELWFR